MNNNINLNLYDTCEKRTKFILTFFFFFFRILDLSILIETIANAINLLAMNKTQEILLKFHLNINLYNIRVDNCIIITKVLKN